MYPGRWKTLVGVFFVMIDRKDTLPLIEYLGKKRYNIKNEKKIQVTLFGYKISVMEGEKV